jgi:hypothetical protein
MKALVRFAAASAALCLVYPLAVQAQLPTKEQAITQYKQSCLMMVKQVQPDVAKDTKKTDGFCQCNGDTMLSKVTVQEWAGAMEATSKRMQTGVKEPTALEQKVSKATQETEAECQQKFGVKPVTAADLMKRPNNKQ